MKLSDKALKILISKYYNEIDAHAFVWNLKRKVESQEEFDSKLQERIKLADDNFYEAKSFITALKKRKVVYYIDRDKFKKEIKILHLAVTYIVNQKRIERTKQQKEWLLKYAKGKRVGQENKRNGWY